ncbi:hypothetical protein Cgig2_021763 [Carnegiea gigantea]|uniref:Uncharacterized protein n=1 Tax=Carnegiea gigantea TaxID=171969 RepID=A0A9Q1GK93_9CARY|nr:hypothetical protein Cgig2_021763 [Carnegiea gigantea]
MILFPSFPAPNRRRSMFGTLFVGLQESLGVVMRYAHNSNIPKMVQAILYAMVLNDAAELGLRNRLTMDYMIGNVPEEQVGPQRMGHHPQCPSLLVLIDGWVVACIPPKNQFREPKKIPYVVSISEPGTSSWSNCKSCSTPSILSIEEDVSYLWEINIAAPSLIDV